MNGRPVAGKDGQNGIYASVVKDINKNEYIVKVANLSCRAQEISISFNNLPRKQKLASEVTCTSIHSDNSTGENTLQSPELIVPVTYTITDGISDNTLKACVGPDTFAVYKIRY
jgi:alpha-L-arabinofuranosidase